MILSVLFDVEASTKKHGSNVVKKGRGRGKYISRQKERQQLSCQARERMVVLLFSLIFILFLVIERSPPTSEEKHTLSATRRCPYADHAIHTPHPSSPPPKGSHHQKRAIRWMQKRVSGKRHSSTSHRHATLFTSQRLDRCWQFRKKRTERRAWLVGGWTVCVHTQTMAVTPTAGRTLNDHQASQNCIEIEKYPSIMRTLQANEKETKQARATHPAKKQQTTLATTTTSTR